jgi:hypothetical protein
MVYVVQSYLAYFGLYPSSCMWKTKNPTTFRRLDLSPSTYKTMDKVQNKPNSSVQPKSLLIDALSIVQLCISFCTPARCVTGSLVLS